MHTLTILAKWQLLELDTTLKHVILAHQYLDIHYFIHSFSQPVSQSDSLTFSQSRGVICDLVVKLQCIHFFSKNSVQIVQNLCFNFDEYNFHKIITLETE